jgi:D-psicose/D-tagatose/L-ribulose 3-epimerase
MCSSSLHVNGEEERHFQEVFLMRFVGIHLSYWQEQWSDALGPIIHLAKAAGFDVAEFPLLAPTQMDFNGLRAELDATGMRASCGTGLGPETDVTHPDKAVREAGLAHLRACVEGAAVLGSPVLGGVTYAPWGVFPADDWSERRKRCIASMREAAMFADDNGVTICMEVLNRFEGYLLNTVEQGLDLLAEIGSSAIKLHLDTFHMNIEEDDLGAAIRRAGDKLGHFHCVANNRKIPGKGHIPWKAVRAALDEIDYQGYLIAETFVNPAGEVGRGLFIWRQLADHLDQEARQAAQFIKGEVAGV